MIDERPDPDAVLAKVQREEAAKHRGRLKVFLGAAAGVGKTYAMLSAAQEKRAEGIDVVVGVVETHGREETAALLQGLEVLPLRTIEYRGVKLHEFDLDGALARSPALILVDELAHTNVPGSRHAKRWRDVEELLEAGIDVYTAINVQHLESLKDVVAGITGIDVTETVPDSVLDRAHEIELVDLPPDELIERLNEGKVYVPQQAERAIKSFFRKGNLIALRELALRRTAERVEEQLLDYREGAGIRDVWQAGERVLVCIGPGADADRVIRAGRRLAATLHADWITAYVETPKLQRLRPADRNAILEDLRLAERLGAETVTLSGPHIGDEISQFARRKNVTKIVLGKPTHTGLQHWLFGSVVDHVVREAEGIDVYLIGGETKTLDTGPARPLLDRSRTHLGVPQAKARRDPPYPRYLAASGITAGCTAVAFMMSEVLERTNLVMVFLLGVLITAARYGRGPSILVAILGVATFDFFFVPPYLTFAVSDTQYLVTFAVMLAVGITISSLMAGMRQQARVASYREERMAALYGMTRELATAQAEEAILRIGVKHVSETFASQAVFLLADSSGKMRYPAAQSMHGSLHGADLGVAQWVYDHTQAAGLGTDTLAGTEAHYVPLIGTRDALGTAAILPSNPRRLFVPEQYRLLELFTNQIGLALERVRLVQQAGAAEMRTESERVRNALLSAISHDLRTPLATIVGAASSLVEQDSTLSPSARAELAHAIHDESRRMARLANNILDMARLEGGAVNLDRQWYPLEELVGGVLSRVESRLLEHPVSVKLAPDLPWVHVDAVSIEQVLENLLENAVKYTPPFTPITITAEARANEVEIAVADRGPGLAPGDEQRIFDKFYRAQAERSQSGVGLGLAICEAIVRAHGGRIWVERHPQGGAVFRFVLPLVGKPPSDEPVPSAT
jgi:two-component system sensor histidine kinase KdpD